MITFLGYDVTIGLANSNVNIPGYTTCYNLTVSDTLTSTDGTYLNGLQVSSDAAFLGNVTISVPGGSSEFDLYGDMDVSGNGNFGSVDCGGSLIVTGETSLTDLLSSSGISNNGGISSISLTCSGAIIGSTNTCSGNIRSTSGHCRGDHLESDTYIKLNYGTLPTFSSNQIGFVVQGTLNTTISCIPNTETLISSLSLTVGVWQVICQIIPDTAQSVALSCYCVFETNTATQLYSGNYHINIGRSIVFGVGSFFIHITGAGSCNLKCNPNVTTTVSGNGYLRAVRIA